MSYDADGSAAPVTVANLPMSFGEGSLDDKATRERRAKGDMAACCYHWYTPCPGGRPLLDEGRVILAGVTFDGEEPPRRKDAKTRHALARAWLEDARAEHASIASFIRAAGELRAVGAPDELIAACHEAALDEVEHAKLCFALASRYAGRRLGPGVLPDVKPRPASLARVACDTFIEGCIGETIAALAAERAAKRARDAEALRALRTIAKDEAKHAELAWRTLGWAIRAGGDDVRAAVREVASAHLTRASRKAQVTQRVSHRSKTLARHGRLDAASVARVQRDAVNGLLAPLLPVI